MPHIKHMRNLLQESYPPDVMVRGVVVVITSPGSAYQKMECAWLANWRKNSPLGLHLLLLDDGLEDSLEHIDVGISRMRVAGASGLIPGILDKTREALRLVHRDFPDSWVFRTNLSSHIRLNILTSVMNTIDKAGAHSLGFSPMYNHLSGAGFGMNAAAVGVLLSHWHVLDDRLIDDVAMSAVLLKQTRIVWTGRLDHVWPDGTHRLGAGPLYHVRVKTQDRHKDADTLLGLALNSYNF